MASPKVYKEFAVKLVDEAQKIIETGKTKEAIKLLPKFNSQLMKIAKVGVIKKQTASRKISRLTKKINKL